MGSSLAMPRPWPNIPVELTAHSAGFLVVPGLGSCGPQLTGGVRRRRGRRDEDHPSAVQLRLRQERPGLADRRSPLLGDAAAPSVGTAEIWTPAVRKTRGYGPQTGHHVVATSTLNSPRHDVL